MRIIRAVATAALLVGGIGGIGGVARADDVGTDPEQPLVPVAAPPPVVVAPPPPVVVPPKPPSANDATTNPDFVTLDRESAHSRLGAELGYPVLSGNGTSNASVYRLDLFGTYIPQGGSVGFYGQVPFSLFHLSGINGSESDTAGGVGDLEAGLVVLIKDTGQDGLSLLAHFGLTAPIASNTLLTASGKAGSGAANYIGIRARYNDAALAYPGGFTVRAGMSGLYKNGAFFARADLAGDFNIDVNNDESFNKDYIYPVVRVNFAGGYNGGKFSAGGELVNLIITDRKQGTIGIDTFALFARLQTNPKTQPYFALTFPVDGESQATFSTVLTIGVDTKLD